jgi:hypothetical protein
LFDLIPKLHRHVVDVLDPFFSLFGLQLRPKSS